MQLSVFRRITPIILALALCLSWLPAGAFAEEVLISEPEESTAATEETLLPTEESAPAAEETTEPTETVPEEILPPETTPEETLPAEPTVPETIPEETEVSETVPAGTAALTSPPPEPLGPGLYFGLLHAHCAFSDGTVTAEEAFSRAARVCGPYGVGRRFSSFPCRARRPRRGGWPRLKNTPFPQCKTPRSPKRRPGRWFLLPQRAYR